MPLPPRPTFHLLNRQTGSSSFPPHVPPNLSPSWIILHGGCHSRRSDFLFPLPETLHGSPVLSGTALSPQPSAWHVRPSQRWPWLASLSSTSATFLQEPSLLTALPSSPAWAMVGTCNSVSSLWILEIPRKAFEKAKGSQCVSKEEGSYHPASAPQPQPRAFSLQQEEARCCFSGCPLCSQ